MISGHRRLHAAQLAGLTAIPSTIREMTDDESVITMLDANIRREELLPSEKAWAYKMKLNAMKRQAGRPSKENAGQNDQNLNGVGARDLLAEQVGESSKQIQRYQNGRKENRRKSSSIYYWIRSHRCNNGRI